MSTKQSNTARRAELAPKHPSEFYSEVDQTVLHSRVRWFDEFLVPEINRMIFQDGAPADIPNLVFRDGHGQAALNSKSKRLVRFEWERVDEKTPGYIVAYVSPFCRTPSEVVVGFFQELCHWLEEDGRANAIAGRMKAFGFVGGGEKSNKWTEPKWRSVWTDEEKATGDPAPLAAFQSWENSVPPFPRKGYEVGKPATVKPKAAGTNGVAQYVCPLFHSEGEGETGKACDRKAIAITPWNLEHGGPGSCPIHAKEMVPAKVEQITWSRDQMAKDTRERLARADGGRDYFPKPLTKVAAA